MAAIHSIASPLVLRFGDDREQVVAACFRHRLGLVWLDLLWWLGSPADKAHLIEGELQGEGPWKIGEVSIRLLGCHHTDPHLEPQLEEWRDWLARNPEGEPSRERVLEVGRKLGGLIE